MSFCNQLSLINPAVSLIFAGCFLVVWRQLRSQHLLAFGVSFALYAVAVAIQVLSPPSDAVWTTLVAAPFYIGSTMLIRVRIAVARPCQIHRRTGRLFGGGHCRVLAACLLPFRGA